MPPVSVFDQYSIPMIIVGAQHSTGNKARQFIMAWRVQTGDLFGVISDLTRDNLLIQISSLMSLIAGLDS
jgi:hypothetical protein